MWKVKVFSTNYGTIGAYVEKVGMEGTVTLYLKDMPVHGTSYCSDGDISECTHCKMELEKKANFVASVLNLHTDDMEVDE